MVFLSDKREHYPVEINQAFRAACHEAHLEDIHFHDLMHTAATGWAETGAQQTTIMELLGHTDARMSARYIHAPDQAKRRAVEQVANRTESQKSGHNLVTMK